jgi:hypothetical protein
MFDDLKGSSLDRRSFLRGSAMFAAAIGLTVVPGFAQQPPQQPQPQPKPEEEKKKEEPPKDPFTEGEKKDGEKKLVDAEGRAFCFQETTKNTKRVTKLAKAFF